MCDFSSAYMYADDMQIIHSFYPDKVSCATTELELDLAKIHNWSSSHGLTLNPSKTSLLTVGSAPLLDKLPSVQVSFASSLISPADTMKNLGLILDPNWSFEQDAIKICNIAYSRLRVLFPSRHYLSSSQKLFITQSLVISV